MLTLQDLVLSTNVVDAEPSSELLCNVLTIFVHILNQAVLESLLGLNAVLDCLEMHHASMVKPCTSAEEVLLTL